MTYLKKGIWWYEFTFAGKLIRKSSGSADRAIARQMETTHRHGLEDSQTGLSKSQNRLPRSLAKTKNSVPPDQTQDAIAIHGRKVSRRFSMSDEQLAKLPGFTEAAQSWIAEHQRYIKPRTVKSYSDAIKALSPFFGNIPLNEIQLAHVRQYQDVRLETITPGVINRELGVFQQILREFDEWKRLESRYRRLIVTRQRAGHSLTTEEEQRLTQVAFSKKKWRLAGHCMMVMLNTTMGFGELRRLRRGDVDMTRKCVTVREGAKNVYRQRTIPLNVSAYESMIWILDRWQRIGGTSDDHYILPHRPRGQRAEHWRKSIPWIFTEPVTAMTSAFESIREAAGLPHFRIYDCRVQAITKLLSNPAVSPQVSKEIAGHISQAMQDRYSIQQFSTKQAALEAMDAATAPQPEVPKGNVVAFFKREEARA
jgi:integrase